MTNQPSKLLLLSCLFCCAASSPASSSATTRSSRARHGHRSRDSHPPRGIQQRRIGGGGSKPRHEKRRDLRTSSSRERHRSTFAGRRRNDGDPSSSSSSSKLSKSKSPKHGKTSSARASDSSSSSDDDYFSPSSGSSKSGKWLGETVFAATTSEDVSSLYDAMSMFSLDNDDGGYDDVGVGDSDSDNDDGDDDNGGGGGDDAPSTNSFDDDDDGAGDDADADSEGSTVGGSESGAEPGGGGSEGNGDEGGDDHDGDGSGSGGNDDDDGDGTGNGGNDGDDGGDFATAPPPGDGVLDGGPTASPAMSAELAPAILTDVDASNSDGNAADDEGDLDGTGLVAGSGGGNGSDGIDGNAAADSIVNNDAVDGDFDLVTDNGNDDSDAGNGTGDSAARPLTLEQRKAIISSKCGHTAVSRSLALLTLIGGFVSDPEEALIVQTGPRYDAYIWLAHFDDAVLCPPAGEEERRRVLQRYALAVVYHSLNGDGWTNCSSGRRWRDDDDDALDGVAAIGPCLSNGGGEGVRFLDPSHECAWFGVSCEGPDGDPLDSSEGTDLNADAHLPVVEMSLPGNNLQGEMPVEFYAAFERMSVWNVEDNRIGGTLSDEVGRLEELRTLKLNDNELEGDVPFGALARLGRLETMHLAGNSLSGDATAFCDALHAEDRDLSSFETDCASAVTCPCCTTSCT